MPSERLTRRAKIVKNKSLSRKTSRKQLLLSIEKALKPLRFKDFFVAGEEGFEASAYGFGDRRSTN